MYLVEMFVLFTFQRVSFYEEIRYNSFINALGTCKVILTSCKEIPLVFLTGLILSCKAVLGDIGSNLV